MPEKNVQTVTVIYKNWKNEVRLREIIPHRLYWGRTEYHPELQWLLEALDTEDGKLKQFAWKDCKVSQKATLPAEPDGKEASECGNCHWYGVPDIGLAHITDLLERIEPGGELPSGECPECGALCYLSKQGKTTREIAEPTDSDMADMLTKWKDRILHRAAVNVEGKFLDRPVEDFSEEDNGYERGLRTAVDEICQLMHDPSYFGRSKQCVKQS